MIQLRLKTEFSFGRTFAPIGRTIECLKEMGCEAAGIVDVDGTWGHVPWFKACKEAGIQPLLGVEMTVADGETDQPQRMWFLARNKTGLSMMYRYCSKAFQQTLKTGRGSVPRLTRNDVRKMAKNIQVFAGDVTDAEFLEEVGAVLDLNPSSRVLNVRKLAIARETDLRLVETSDNAYMAPEDRTTFEFMANYRTSGLKETPQHILPALDHQEAAATVAKDCRKLALPIAPMVRAEGDLEALCREGIKFRGLEEGWTDEYEKRLMYELGLIESKDFTSYFLIVADMTQYAKQHMLVGPSRGSAAGSLVCYLCRITEIDPIPPNLYFERFIDVTRTDLPDIDLDFPDNKRYMVFEYMSEKYGVDNISHIGTVAVYKPRSALIQVCKALNIPPSATAGVKVVMIERGVADARGNFCLQDTLETTKPGQDFVAAYPQAKAACLLEGHASHTGTHAAGLLVCNRPITNFATVNGDGIAQVDKYSAEHVGLLKIDVLGLRTLAVLEDSGVPLDWYHLPMDDQATYDLFNSGRLCGIFQFEGNALRSIAEKINFETMNDIDAVTAIARPGPFISGVAQDYIARKNGKPYKAIHPLVEKHMAHTFGLPLYQEQTLAIVREIGKFDWKQTSLIRKAVSKRLGVEYFERMWETFCDGAVSQGIPVREAREAWDRINAMGSWQMNKAHTYSYATISYWAAYLKAHHLMEFAAATLRSAKSEDNSIQLLRELEREGVRFVPFDIDKSEANWCTKDGVLYGGFLSLHGIGEAKAAKLIESRKVGGITDKQREFCAKAKNPFNDIWPFRTKYGHMYDDPVAANIGGKLWHVDEIPEDLPHREERVFIGELLTKSLRNANEEILIKKRGGVVEKDRLDFLDVRIRDDTGIIGGRISRYDYQRIGREMLEFVPEGAHVMIRAKFFNGIRYAFVTKWRRIDE